MPGRPLRRARLTAIDNLTDEQASDLAYAVVAHHLRPSDVSMLYIATRPQGLDAMAALTHGTGRVDRIAMAHAITADPVQARQVIATYAHLPTVESALGVSRSPRQARR